MACESCEERRQKIKAMYESSRQSISNAIARLGGRADQAEQSSAAAEQSADSTPGGSGQSLGESGQSDQSAVADARRAGRGKQS